MLRIKAYVFLVLLLVGLGASISRIPIKRSQNTVSSSKPLASLGSTVPINVDSDTYYYASITLGSNSQSFSVLIDTGRIGFWVVDSSCTNDFCSSRSSFQSGDSDSFVDKKKSTSVSYGGGYSIKGKTAQDTLVMGDLTTTSQDFILASKTYKFSSEPFDGIMGLAYTSKTNSKSFLTPVENAFKAGSITDKVFSLKIAQSSGSDSAGSLIIGGTDSTLYQGDITYANVSKKGVWGFKTSKIAIVNDTTSVIQKKGASVRVETILSKIGAPSGDIKKIAKILGGKYDKTSKVYAVSCDYLSSTTNLVFTISGIDFSVPPASYIAQNSEDDTCYLNLSAQSGWILGQTFLVNYYSVYDETNNKIGFAQYA